MNNELSGHWMNWNEIEPYKDQIIDMEVELTQKYHYPDREFSRSYPETRVNLLEKYLSEGNTFFWGVTDGDVLVCYYWAYIELFLEKKRWVLRSLMVNDNYRFQGFGKEAVSEGIKMARIHGCYDAVTDYAPFNKNAGSLYESMGYEVSRIEMVKKL